MMAKPKIMVVNGADFLHFLLADRQGQHKSATRWFVGAEGQVKLITSTQFRKQMVVDILRQIVSLPLLALEERRIFQNALVLCAKTELSLQACPHRLGPAAIARSTADAPTVA